MSRVRIHNFSISLDGYATGEGQALDTPFGHAGHRLHEWMFATQFGRRDVLGQSGGTEGVDDAMAGRHGPGIGAEIMGAGKFGPPGWQDDGLEGLEQHYDVEAVSTPNGVTHLTFTR